MPKSLNVCEGRMAMFLRQYCRCRQLWQKLAAVVWASNGPALVWHDITMTKHLYC